MLSRQWLDWELKEQIGTVMTLEMRDDWGRDESGIHTSGRKRLPRMAKSQSITCLHALDFARKWMEQSLPEMGKAVETLFKEIVFQDCGQFEVGTFVRLYRGMLMIQTDVQLVVHHYVDTIYRTATRQWSWLKQKERQCQGLAWREKGSLQSINGPWEEPTD